MVTSLVVNVGQLGWQKFDVTKVVSRWYMTSYSKDKLTLLVDCSGCGSHVHVSTFDGYSPHVIESSLNSKGNSRTISKNLKKIRNILEIESVIEILKIISMRCANIFLQASCKFLLKIISLSLIEK